MDRRSRRRAQRAEAAAGEDGIAIEMAGGDLADNGGISEVGSMSTLPLSDYDARAEVEARAGLIADVVLAHRAEGATPDAEDWAVDEAHGAPVGAGARQGGAADDDRGVRGFLRRWRSAKTKRGERRRGEREADREVKRHELLQVLRAVGLQVSVQHTRDGGEAMLKVRRRD